MDVSKMSLNIIKMIDEKYDKKYTNEECLDIRQIKDICNLYKTKQNNINSINLSEIQLSTPDFKKNNKINKKNRIDTLKSPEFLKKYTFFVKIMYSCLKMNVELFDLNNDALTLKNNYHIIKSLELEKKKLITEHVEILKVQYKNISQIITTTYENYYKKYITKIKIIDRIIYSINKIIKAEICDNTDNLLTLILPYFYTYTEFIEEYN